MGPDLLPTFQHVRVYIAVKDGDPRIRQLVPETLLREPQVGSVPQDHCDGNVAPDRTAVYVLVFGKVDLVEVQ